MYKAILRFKETGECWDMDLINDSYIPEKNEEIVETINLRTESYHKHPFKSEKCFVSIKLKVVELLSKHNYIFGLDSGWLKDAEYKQWCEDLIALQKSYENTTITEKSITFPVDPWGNQEVLTF